MKETAMRKHGVERFSCGKDVGSMKYKCGNKKMIITLAVILMLMVLYCDRAAASIVHGVSMYTKQNYYRNPVECDTIDFEEGDILQVNDSIVLSKPAKLKFD